MKIKKIFVSVDKINQIFNFTFENITKIIEEKIINIFNDNININENDSISLWIIAIYYQYKIKDYNKMKEYYLKAIKLGFIPAMVNLGFYYQYAEKNYDKMKEYYLMGINLNSASAMYNLGMYYKNIECDYENMKKYYLMGSELKCKYCTYNLGNYYFNIKDYDNGIKYYMMAINNGSIEAYTVIEKYEKNKLYKLFFDFYMENEVSCFFVEKSKEVKKDIKNLIPITPINDIRKYIYETYVIHNIISDNYNNNFIIYAKKDNEIKKYYVNNFILNSKYFLVLIDGPFEKTNSTNIDVIDFKIIDILIKYLYINKLDYEDMSEEEIKELLRIADYWEFVELIKFCKILLLN